MQLMERHLLPMLQVLSQRQGTLTKDFVSLTAVFELCLLFTKQDPIAPQAPPQLLLDHRMRIKRLFESTAPFSSVLAIVISAIDQMKHSDYPENMVLEIIKRSLSLVRQVVHIPDSTVITSEFGRQHRVMRAIYESKLMAFLVVASASLRHPNDGRIFSPHAAVLVDIIGSLYLASDPDAIASALSGKSSGQRGVESVLREDDTRKIRKPTRHSRFSGSLSVRLATSQAFLQR
jgi:hypothetical protein